MRKLLVLAFATSLAMALADRTSGALFSDDFEAYGVGQILDGGIDDGGWAGWNNNALGGRRVPLIAKRG